MMAIAVKHSIVNSAMSTIVIIPAPVTSRSRGAPT
jgi:hypothetical protein